MRTVTETFNANEFKLCADQPSLIRDGHTYSVIIGVGCPRCNTVNIGRYPEHNETTECRACGLKMTLHGNALECEAEIDD